jgi:hypothetical protein
MPGASAGQKDRASLSFGSDGLRVTTPVASHPASPSARSGGLPQLDPIACARISTCATCSGGKKVRFVGSGGTLTDNQVTVATAGTYRMTVAYLDRDGPQAQISANGAAPQTVSFPPTGTSPRSEQGPSTCS